MNSTSAFTGVIESLSLCPQDLVLLAAVLEHAASGLEPVQAGTCRQLAAALRDLPPDYYVLQPE